MEKRAKALRIRSSGSLGPWFAFSSPCPALQLRFGPRLCLEHREKISTKLALNMGDYLPSFRVFINLSPEKCTSLYDIWNSQENVLLYMTYSTFISYKLKFE